MPGLLEGSRDIDLERAERARKALEIGHFELLVRERDDAEAPQGLGYLVLGCGGHGLTKVDAFDAGSENGACRNDVHENSSLMDRRGRARRLLIMRLGALVGTR